MVEAVHDHSGRQGIGAAIGRRLAAEGVDVVVKDCEAANADEALVSFRLFEPMFGRSPNLGIFVNNTGIGADRQGAAPGAAPKNC